ncbi:MAG: redoxin domain-containing protein [Verrucomicrobiota bacterium]|jgi:thiol-disulfide isomerase/thioredoxin|nr:redoxin domain-containing protein [Verrucomicrobiota bacterium]
MNIALARKAPALLLMLLAALGLLSVPGGPLFAGESSQSSAGVVAPELTGDSWLNLPKGSRLSIAILKGRVTIVHFWTFGCINCKRNLPAYSRWWKRFADKGVVVIGIHTPETEAERDPANVAKKVKELGIGYPVLLDAEHQNWNRWQQRIWPAIYLIDKQGRVRYLWEGELEYQNAGGEAKMTRLIVELLKGQ